MTIFVCEWEHTISLSLRIVLQIYECLFLGWPSCWKDLSSKGLISVQMIEPNRKKNQLKNKAVVIYGRDVLGFLSCWYDWAPGSVYFDSFFLSFGNFSRRRKKDKTRKPQVKHSTSCHIQKWICSEARFEPETLRPLMYWVAGQPTHPCDEQTLSTSLHMGNQSLLTWTSGTLYLLHRSGVLANVI